MIKFRQKIFAEFDAMRSLYVEIMRRTGGNRNQYQIINPSALVPILKGNNIVIERFVISTSTFGRDKYRLYLKIGAKAKLPDEVRLPAKYYEETLGNVSLEMKSKINMKDMFSSDNNNQQNNGGDKKKKKNNGGGDPSITSNARIPGVYVKYDVEKLLGEAVKYDKVNRSLVLEFNSIGDAIDALNILPFGMNYKIYLLDA